MSTDDIKARILDAEPAIPIDNAHERNETNGKSPPSFVSVVSFVEQKEWPAPPGDPAYRGLAGDFVRAVEPFTEADPVALLVCFLAAAGNAMGASAHVRIAADHHPAKLWPILVGATSSGRKGTAAGVAELVARRTSDQERS